MMSDKIYIILLFITVGVKILSIILKRCKKSNNRHDKLVEKVINITSLISKLFFIYNVCFLIINYTTGSVTIAVLYIIIKIILTIFSFIYKLEEQMGGDFGMLIVLLCFPFFACVILLLVICIPLYIEMVIEILL